MSFFSSSSDFSYTKSENRRVEQVLPVGVGTSGKGRRRGDGEGI
jgi:hypothetical protein